MDVKLHAGAAAAHPAASPAPAAAAAGGGAAGPSAAAAAVSSGSSSNGGSGVTPKSDAAIEAVLSGGVLLKQGAEARVYVSTWLGRKAIVKERFSKQYRHPALDRKLTDTRLTTEVRCMVKCRGQGVACPAVYFVDSAVHHRIVMEFVDGKTLREVLEGMDLSSTAPAAVSAVNALGAKVGAAIYGLHSAGVIHGDLTSSNLIVGTSGQVVVIDFGLSYVDSRVEDRAVDLYVLERALLSTHPHSQPFFDAILTAYHSTKKDSTKVISKLQAVRLRGRKRSMVG